MIKSYLLTLLSFCLLCASCSEEASLTHKFLPGDPFAEHMPASQHFNIAPGRDTAFAGELGTTVIALDNSFIYTDGSPVTSPVELSLTEALRMKDMLKSNISSMTENGELLQTAGAIHLEMHDAVGKEVIINPKAPLQISIPTMEVEPDMQVFQGVRKANGEMRWKNPEPIPSYLETVPLESLDFLPEGFALEVKKGMPMWGHETADDALIDSVYYALSEFQIQGEMAAHYPHPCWKGKLGRVTNSIASKDSIISYKSYEVEVSEKDHSSHSDGLPESKCPVDPLQIKSIRQPIFEHSYIATKAFEKRVQALHQTCGYKALEHYINNTEKDLWQVDQEVAAMLKDEKAKKVFEAFAKEKLTNVREADRYSKALKKMYKRILKDNKKELQKANQKLERSRKLDKKQFDRAMKQYEKIVWKREKHHMQFYNFTNTRKGWLAPAKLKDCTLKPNPAEVRIESPERFDVLAVYAVFPKSKTINAFDQLIPGVFSPHFVKATYYPYPANEYSYFVGIGYKDRQAYLAKYAFKGDDNLIVTLEMKPVSRQEMNLALHPYNNFPRDSDIRKDLEFQWKKVKEARRLQRIEDEFIQMNKLHSFITGSCIRCEPEGGNVARGKKLFSANCASCHKPVGDLVGPGLIGKADFYCKTGDIEFLYAFIRNSQGLVKKGDPRAVRLYEQWGKQVMTAFPTLSDQDIRDILAYCDAWERM